MTHSAPQKIPPLSHRLLVTGMHCGSCVARVEAILLKQPGVTAATVNLASGEAVATVNDPGVRPRELADALTAAGYTTEVRASRKNHVTRSASGKFSEIERRNLLLAVMLTLPVFVMEMGSHFSGPFARWLNAMLGLPMVHGIELVLSGIVLFVAGREFFKIGIPALLRRAPEMNSLVALGGSAAWFFSAIVTIAPGWLPAGGRHVYFEAAAVIVTLILLGRYLEARARGRTSAAIDALAKLQPTVALVRRDGQYVEVPIEQVNPGDQLQVRPGERIPVDGTVVSGNSRVDESMLTGESVPLTRQTGDKVHAGTINLSGSIQLLVNATGDNTTLAAIIDQVWDAQNTKLPIQALVDKIAMWFVPLVMGIALLTFAAWLTFGDAETALQQAVVHAIAVLIVACPCAMGLATPLSVMVGTGRAAHDGMLFRHGDALQRLGQVKAIAFDKTGTLTLGQPAVTQVVTADGFDSSTLLSLLASVQQHSEHPLADAVVAASRARGLTLGEATHFEAIAGQGVIARVGKHEIIAGNKKLFASQGISSDALSAQATLMAKQGQTVFLVAVDGQLAGMIAVADPIRQDAQAALASLKADGIKLVMLSGDRTETAQAVGRTLGIDQVLGEVLPGQKRTQIAALRNQYGAVAFVGDGINDAPALAEADIGIAIGSGADVAIEAADLVLAGNNLMSVPRALQLSRSAMRNIWQNLFWAFLYNLLLIPVAAGAFSFAGVYLSPMLAAAAMSLSSLFVVFNALRLNHTPTMKTRPTVVDPQLASAT